VKTVIFQCDGKCGAATDKLEASGWHAFTMTDMYERSYAAHICPVCWPSLTFAAVVDRL
jgi:hypothetical protein